MKKIWGGRGFCCARPEKATLPQEYWHTKPEDAPRVDQSREKLQVNPALADMLRVLVKAKSDNEGVAQKLIATSADLDAIAGGLRDVAALRGWRKEVFGADALRLCDGEIGLAVKGEKVVTFNL